MNAIGNYTAAVNPAQTQNLSNNATIAFNIAYTPTPVNAPSNLSVDNSICSQLRLTWQDNSGNEDGFIISRSTSSGAELEIARVGANQTTFTDIPPATDASYYYIVQAYRNSPQQASASNEVNGFNQSCTANFANTRKIITKVNGASYTGPTAINDGDTLTYQITLVNSGPANATINYICEYPSSNLINLRNLSVSGVGAVNGGITASSPSCGDSYRLNVSGTKNVANNWLITFDVTVDTASADIQEVITNSMTVNYTDSSTKNWSRSGPNVIVNSAKGKTPGFIEVAP